MLSYVYSECRKQTHYAECRYAERRGAVAIFEFFKIEECCGCKVLLNFVYEMPRQAAKMEV